MNKSIQYLAISLISFFFICLWNQAAQTKTNKNLIAEGEYRQTHRETVVMKIMSLLETKVGDQKLLEKAKEKLSTLREPEFSLITSLAEQITKEGDRPGVNIAFLLLTALIIFS